MPLATFDNANSWLDQYKVKFTNDTDASEESQNADTLVRSRLFVAFGDVVNQWDDSLEVPDLVIDIAAMLMASFRLEKLYSMESLDENDYAERLYKRAMMLIDGLRDGSITLADTELVSTFKISRDDFYPNDKTPFRDDQGDTGGRKFTSGMVF